MAVSPDISRRFPFSMNKVVPGNFGPFVPEWSVSLDRPPMTQRGLLAVNRRIHPL